MQFFSTRDQNRKVTSSEAIAQGLSNEGGLFVPESFPQVDVKALCELDYPAMAAAVIKEYLTDYSQDFLTEAARKTYGDAFGGKAGYLAPVEGDTYALELWHGPTCAFKDYALQLMPKLLVEAKKNLGRTEKTLILVAIPARQLWTATMISRAWRSRCSIPRAAPARSSVCRWQRRRVPTWQSTRCAATSTMPRPV